MILENDEYELDGEVKDLQEARRRLIENHSRIVQFIEPLAAEFEAEAARQKLPKTPT